MRTAATTKQMINQLSLFDTSAAEVGSFYKPGDWVKIKKVPAIAKHVKCGHVYQLASVETSSGRLEFWNPFIAQWDFLFPNEVKLAVVPTDHVDSVTLVEVAVTESFTPEPAADSVTPAEVAVTESFTPEPAADSVTPAEVAVTESNCPHSAIYIVSLADAVTESNCQHSDIDSVTPAEVAVTESLIPEPGDYFSAVSVYTPRGTARGKQYYRLSYKSGGKVRHVHIRGGNTNSPIAQAKVREVRSLLAAGITPAEIAAMLKN